MTSTNESPNQSRMDYYRERFAASDRERQRLHENSHEYRQERILAGSLEEFRRIANAAEAQSKLAEQEARDARKDARDSKIISIISVSIAFLSLLLSAVVAFAFR